MRVRAVNGERESVEEKCNRRRGEKNDQTNKTLTHTLRSDIKNHTD